MKSRLALACSALLLASSSVNAQTMEVLKLIPADAWGFAVINNLERANGRFMTLAKTANAPVPGSPLAQFKQFFGITKGLNGEGSAGIAILPGDNPPPQGEPAVALIIPVTKYGAFLKGMGINIDKKIAEFQTANGEDALVANRGNFAILVQKKHKSALQKVLTTKGIAAQTKSLHKWLSESDAAGVGTKAGIQFACNSAQQGINLLLQFQNPQTEQEKMGVEWMKRGADWLGQIGQNVTLAGIGANLDDKGMVRGSLRTRFVKGGTFAKAGAEVTAPKGGMLGGLPDSPFLFSMGFAYPKAMREVLVELAQIGFTANPAVDLSDKQKKQLLSVTKAMYNEIRGVSFSMNMPGKKGSLMSGMASTMTVTDSTKYLKTYVKSIRVMQKLLGDAVPGNPVGYQIKEIKKGDRYMVELTTSMDFGGALPQGQEKIFEAIFGKDNKMRMTFAAVDKKTLVMAAVPAKKFGAWFMRYNKAKKRLTDRAEVKKLSAKFQAGSQWVMIVSPHRIAAFAKQFAKNIPGTPDLPAFPKGPAVGKAFRLSPEGFDGDLVVPLAVIENAATYFRNLQNAIQGAVSIEERQ